MRTLLFLVALVRTVLRASLALRGAFLLQAAFMLLNNCMFFTTWWILFQRFEHIRGYRIPDMLVLFGISNLGYGLAMVLCGGALDLARTIDDGGLDPLLAQPRSVLVRAVASRSIVSGWGDLASGVLMLALSDSITLARVPLVLLAGGLGATVLVSFAIVLNSAAFWLRQVDSFSTFVFHYLVVFTIYPPTLFGPLAKVLLFTLLPAGLVTYLPVEMVRAPRLDTVLLAIGGAALALLVARTVFARGLRRYESGSRFVAFG